MSNTERNRISEPADAADDHQYGDRSLLSEREAQRVLGNPSLRTLQNWRYRGGGPPYFQLSGTDGTGGLIRYRYGDLLEWIEACRRTSTSDQGARAS